jgi:hypothetical protein
MTLPAADLGGTIIRPYWLGWFDFVGDPVFATTLPADFTPTGTGDPELDDITFISLPDALVDITSVINSDEGSQPVEAILSGLPPANDDLLAIVADPSKWRGRTVRLWRGLTNGSFAPAVLEAYHTGYMMSLELSGTESSQTIRIISENYLSVFTTPRGRTYQDQALYDATDNSPARIRAAANGIQSAGGFLPGQNPWQGGVNYGGWDFSNFGGFF